MSGGCLVVRGGFSFWGCRVGGWLLGWGLVGGVCWFGGLAGGRVGIVVSARPGWARNYLTYFSVYSARLVRACARARTVPGTPVGRMPLRSQVFERRLPPGPVAIFTDGVGRRCLGSASLGSLMEHAFLPWLILDYLFGYGLSRGLFYRDIQDSQDWVWWIGGWLGFSPSP